MILGIETSCDETALAIVSEKGIHENILYSQVQEHAPYGGVVPEFAARAHLEKLPYLMQSLESYLPSLTGIAVTVGPGLIGGLLVGYHYAQALAFALGVPCYGVNHLEGHALTVRMTDGIDFPFLLLLISGGHCMLVDVEDFRRYRVLGETMDDSCGELLDKTAMLMGLGYPGGPAIEALARSGDPHAIVLPKPLCREKNCNFSFSGLKTAVREVYQKQQPAPEDLAASLQHTIAEVLIDRIRNARTPHKRIVMAGGVAANQYIRTRLQEAVDKEFVIPPPKLCTDNAAMIAWVGVECMRRGIQPEETITPRPRWRLEEMAG